LWSIAGPSALALTAQVGFLYHLVAIVEARFGRGDAATAMAVTAICGFSGRMALGTVIDRLEPRLATAACVGTQGLALILLLGSESRAAVFASSAVFGCSIGNVLMLPILTVQRELPPAAFGKAVGLSTAIAQFAFSVGPGVLGLLRDWTGSYSVPLLFCVSLQAAACMVALAGRRRQTRAEARHRSGSAEIC
jgi:predicted MFS family arabinose efflux permease